MKILFININYNWVYNLFIEYILNIKEFINNNYDNIKTDIIQYEIKYFDINSFDIFLFMNYDKIIYSGDIKIFNLIINKINLLYPKLEKIVYYLNIEQLSHPSYYKNFRNINDEIKIIDYSEENIPYINVNHQNKYLIPPYFKRELIDIQYKTIDILSLENNNYRKDLIKNINNELINENLPLIKSFDNLYSDERDELFKKTKIYINIHCSDEHNTMEMIRIVNLLCKNVIIISFNTVNSTLIHLYNNIIIVNSIKEVVSVVNEIYKNYNIYYDYYLKKFDYDEYLNYIKNSLDNLF